MRRKLYLTSLALALMAAPATLAHTDEGGPGTPDFTCQAPSEWATHDYATEGGRFLTGLSDWNLEECGTTYGLFFAGTPECREIEDRLGMGPGDSPWEMFCNTDRPADYDGDLEFAIGGAVLAVTDGDGATYGSIVCLGTDGHHGAGWPIGVEDQIFSDVAFSVGADASIPGTVPPGEPDCGDGTTRPCDGPATWTGDATVDGLINEALNGACNPDDHVVSCLNRCTVPFGPGAEGTYIVWVYATAAGNAGNPTGASFGHVCSFCGSGAATEATPPDGPILDLLSNLTITNAGCSTCNANCLFGTCSVCCDNHESPLCYCELSGHPRCECIQTTPGGKTPGGKT